MERVQVRIPDEDLEKIKEEVEKGRYPNKSEAIRDKIRKSYLFQAILNMREATEDVDKKEALRELEKVREEKYEDFKDSN